MEAKSHGGSFWREISFGESCVDGSKLRPFWWLAHSRRWIPGVVRWWDRSQGALLARFGENLIFGSRSLFGGKSQRSGASLLPEGGSRASRAGGSGVTWWLTLDPFYDRGSTFPLFCC